MKFKDSTLIKLLPLVILSLAVFLRFYHLEELMYFNIDEGRYSFLMKRIVLDKHPSLIGIAIPGGFYLGPGYFIFGGILQLLVNFDPAKMGAIASLFGVLSTWGIYLLAKKMFGRRTGIFSMAVYCFSYLVVIYNRIFWPLTLSSVSAVVTYWGLFHIVKSKQFWWLYPIAILLTIGSHSDASYFSLVLLVIFILTRFKPKGIKKPAIIAASIFLLAQTPLILFDLRHNFYNSKLLLQFLSPSTSTFVVNPGALIKSLSIFPKSLARVLMPSSALDITYQLSPSSGAVTQRESVILLPLVVLSLTLLLGFFFKKWPQRHRLSATIINTHLGIAIGGVAAYSLLFPGYAHEWFISILLPAVAIIVGYFLSLMIKHSWSWLVITAMVFFSAANIQALLKTQNSFGYGSRRQAVEYAIAQVGDKSFYLDAIGSQAYGGYRYLFWLLGKEPAHSYMDNIYGDWIYPMPKNDQQSDLGVIMLSFSDFESEKPEDIAAASLLRKQAIAAQRFGGIEVLIIPVTGS